VVAQRGGQEHDACAVDSRTERVSPAGRDAHHVVGDVVARYADRLDAARVLNVLGETEQRHVVVGDAAVVSLVRDHLHHVDDLLRPFIFAAVVFAQHHAEVRRFVRRLSALQRHHHTDDVVTYNARWSWLRRVILDGTVFGRANHLSIAEPPAPTQPSTLSGTRNEYRPKCGNALRLRSKDRVADVDKRVGDRCDPSLTRVNLSATEMSLAHIIKCYTNALFTYLHYVDLA